MNMEKIIKPSFVIIGKEGSTNDGDGFIKALWKDASEHFNEVETLAKRDMNGNLEGFWGAMSDFSHSFKPWDNNFKCGLYLAGVECKEDAVPPLGWTKWEIPGFEYFRIQGVGHEIFTQGLSWLKNNGYSLAGAVHDFTDPTTKKNYQYYPIRKL